MATTLYSILTFTLAAGAQQTQNHGLHWSGRAVKPDEVKQDNTGFTVLACTDLSITVVNGNSSPATCHVLCESWPDRAFGSSSIVNLTPQPFVVSSSGGSGGGAIVTDGTTISGLGTLAQPLAVIPAGLDDAVAVLTDGLTISGTGKTGSPISLIGTAAGPAGIIDVSQAPYNADRTGATSALAAFVAAANAAPPNSVIWCPPGSYLLPRDGTNFWCFNVPKSNVTFMGVRGLTWFLQPTGMPAAQIPLVRVDSLTNVNFIGIGINGQWGNYAASIAYASDGLAASTGTYTVNEDLTLWPATGTFDLIPLGGGTPLTITYTGRTTVAPFQFTGCTGGDASILVKDRRIIRVDDNVGINQTTQTDPKNHGIMIRGSTNCLIRDCMFQQVYGDPIWLGASGTTGSGDLGAVNIRIEDCDSLVSARSGVAAAQKAEGITIVNSNFIYVFAQAFDTEPGGGGRSQYVRNITLRGCTLDGWVNPGNAARSVNSPLSIVGGGTLWPNAENFARNYRVSDCTINGSIYVADAVDVRLTNNRIMCDFSGYSYAPILMVGFCDDCYAESNYIYDRTLDAGGQNHEASISVQFSGSGTANYQPQGIFVLKNTIHTRRAHGIKLESTGGTIGATGTATSAITNSFPPDSSGVAGVQFNGATGDATHVNQAATTWTVNQWTGWYVRAKVEGVWGKVSSNTTSSMTIGGWIDDDGNAAATPTFGSTRQFNTFPTITDNTKTWTPNQWAGRALTMGGKTATVYANFVTDLVLDRNSAWTEINTATRVPTPALGTYTILSAGGYIDCVGNKIDCTNDGNGHGGYGVYLNASRAGMRVRVDNNESRNAQTDGIHIQFSDSARPYVELEITNNIAWDDQVVHTCTTGVNFDTPQYITHLTLRNNKAGDGVVTDMAGITSGVWNIQNGNIPEWAGYGSPEGVITAPIGALFHRKDGGSGTTIYCKQANNTLATGWAPLSASSGSTIPAYIEQCNLVGATFDPCIGTSVVAVAAIGTLTCTRIRVYASTFSQIAFTTGVAMVGGTNAYIGVFKSDGTQTAEMLSATVDALTTMQAAPGFKVVNFTNAISVSPGDDIILALLIVGGGATLPQLRHSGSAPELNADLTTFHLRQFTSGAALTAIPGSVATGTSGGNMTYWGLR